MRYLLLLASITACVSVSVAAEVTETIEMPPGATQIWHSPNAFSKVFIGNPNVVDAAPGTNHNLIIGARPAAGTTNILLIDDQGTRWQTC